MNVSQGGKTMCLDFEKEVKSWEVICDMPKQFTQQSFLATEEDSTTLEAKRNELDNWVRNKVYSVVKDTGQNKITIRWVMTEKMEEGRKVAKARLVAKGFQDSDGSSVRTDSPTCSKEGLKLALAVIATNGWKCNALDVKTAFFHGHQINRPVYQVPPHK